MAKICERCLAAFDDTTKTCPYCGSNTNQDQRSFERLSKEGYLMAHLLLSRTEGSVPQNYTTSTGPNPSSDFAVKPTCTYNPQETSHVEWTHVEPVHIDVDDELERLRRGYEMSVAAIENSEHGHESDSTQQTSEHASQQDSFAGLYEARTVEPSAAQSVDEHIESLSVDILHAEQEGYTDKTPLTRKEGSDTTEWLPPVVPGNVEWDDIEALGEMRERADREYRRTARREAFVGFLRDLATPGTAPHWIAAALFLILCVWLFIVYALPAMLGAIVETVEYLIPYLMAVVLLIYIYRLLIHP